MLQSIKQTYLPQIIEISLFIGLAIQVPKEATWEKILVLIMRMLAVAFVPVFSYFYLWEHRRELIKNKRIRIMYGVLYQDVLTMNRPAIRTIVWFCLRRVIVGIGVVLFSNFPSLLFGVLFFSQMWILSFFIVVKPLNQKHLNWLDQINELFVLMSFYPLLYFTNWCGDMDLRYHAGSIYLYIVLSMICLNFFFILHRMVV